MKILQTPIRFYPYIGGVEMYVYNLSKKHANSGHSVTVVCAKAEPGTQKNEVIDGITVRRLQSIGQISNTNIMPTLPKVILEEARDADVIHTHIPTPWSADLSAIAGAITNTPVVVTYHNDITGSGLTDIVSSVYNKTMLKLTLDIAKQIIVTQPDYLRDSKYIEQYEHKTRVIHNGVDVQRFRPVKVNENEKRRLGFDSDRSNIFFLSVLDGHHEYKGLGVLLKSIQKLANSEDDVPKLLVGGDGEARSEYRKQVNDLGIENHVEFLGRVPEADLVPLYSEADLFVLPSKSSDQEGFGLVVLEALACGTPVVTTEVVGVSSDIVGNNSGILVDTGDSESLSIAIARSINSDEFDTEQGRRVCRENYSWEAAAKELEQLYYEVSNSYR